MKKRFLSILLAVCMVLTLLPTVALAADGSNESFTITGGTLGTDYTYTSGVLTVCSNTAITIQNTDPSTSTTDRIEVTSAANITLAGVNIDVSGTDWTAAFRITSSAGAVSITLADGSVNTLKSGIGCAGLQKDTTAEGTMLTIDGTGTLNAIGKSDYNDGGSGIGGGNKKAGSYITISGGTVNATGGYKGAGIGGGDHATGSSITITGGTVNATGGYYGTGIGGGYWSTGSSITISGGTVNAIATGGYAEGIGTGHNQSGYSSTNITITGGNVKASSIGGPPTNGAANVYKAVIPIAGDTTGDTDVSSMTFIIGGTAYTYNMNGAKSILDAGAGKVYVYLPGSSAGIATTASFGGTTYPGSVKNDNAAVLNPVFPVTKTAATNGSFTTKINTNEITQAAAGNTVTITPAANSGYEVDTVSVCKTGDTSTTVAVSNNTFTMPAYAVTVSVTFKAVISPLDLTGVGYNVAAGTLTGTTTNMQYSLDGGSSWQDCTAGNTTGLTFIADTAVKVRQKDKVTNEATVATLASPAAPAYVIDYVGEKTTVSVPATVEYNTTSSDAETWTAGTGTILALVPDTTYYFRFAATDEALAGNVQTLTVPARPDAPEAAVMTIAAGEDASHTALTLANTYEYILAASVPGASASGTAGTGASTEVTATEEQHVYIRVKAAAAFASDWTDCGGVLLGVDSITLSGVGFDVAAGKLTGTTTNMQYSLDGGSTWQDCAAGNTTGLTFSAGTVKVHQKDNTTNERTIITIVAPAASNAPALESKTSGSVTLTAMAGYEYSKDGGVTWQVSNSFSGLSGGTAYSFVARIKATATTLPGTVSTALPVTTSSVSSGGGTGSGSGTSSGTGAPVIVDGKTQNIGTEKKSGDTTTVTVDQSKLGTNIGGAASGSSVVVPVNGNSVATASLVVKNIEDMAQKGMTLTVQTGGVVYNLNTSAIDTAALTAAFPGVDRSKVPFDVTITNSSVSIEGETLVLSPVAFTVTATYGGKTVDVDTFSAYIDRVIEVTKEQAAKITTAVVVNADGSVRHVPTNVIEKDGKYCAVINSRTNSTYVLIQNEVTFVDAKGKWYEATVNEMGSRKIIAGRSKSVFDGEASITRAEFAAILIRALGLPADGTSAFSDVPADAWYTGAVATAVKYGLAEGKGDNQFDPTANITRQEAMLMLQRAAVLTEFAGTSGQLDSFADADSVGSWARDAVKWSVGSGLIQGADGRLNPTTNITRAESATIILRLLQKAGLVDVRSKA